MERKRVEGIVTSIKVSTNPADNVYTIISDRIAQIKSSLVLDLYDRVSFDRSDVELKEVRIEGSAKKADYEDIIDACIGRIGIEKNAAAIDTKSVPYGKAIGKAMPELVGAARVLARCFLSGSPIIARFHNDGDGFSGATALYRALNDLQGRMFENERNVIWHMNRSIAYTLESAYEDDMLFGVYRSIEKPLMLITDFGTSPESMDAIGRMSGMCELVWLDHHLPYEGFPIENFAHYINAWSFGGDSNTTAGLIACVLAQVMSRVDIELLKQASLISDYSEYADLGNREAYKLALVMDFLTSGKSRYDSQGATPKQLETITSDKQRFEEVFGFATKLLDDALAVGLKNIKSYRSGAINVHVLDFGHVAKLGYSYPLPGRYSSKLQEHMEALNNGNTITVTHYGSYISIRESRDVSGKVKLLDIINRMKETGEAAAGGGHSEAASIRIGGKNMEEVVRSLLTELGVRTRD
jgi:RecJ-like exonuclease